MTATVADLERLIGQATPRVEDHRSIDRTDFVRKEHGHLNLREVCNSLDALEFSVESFVALMKELSASAEGGESESAATAVHGLLRAVSSISLLTPASATAQKPPADSGDSEVCEPAAEPKEGWQEAAGEAKAAGGECFKSKDFATALTHYSAAICATPSGHESLSALYSNRSAALLQLARPAAALEDALRCTALAPEWPKGYFRKGSCLSALLRFEEAAAAFREGKVLEPTNKDWEREMGKAERQHRALPSTQAKQLVWHLLPEMLTAWVRSGGDAAGGVLQAQVQGELEDLGTPKWQRLNDKKDAAKAQIRYAFVDAQSYMTNLAANLAAPPEGVAVVDLASQPLKIAEVRPFVSGDGPATSAIFHIDVKVDGKMVAIICKAGCDEQVRRFLPPHKDPAPPKGGAESLQGVLQLQAKSGFPKVLPKFLGFQTYPGGDVNYPVIDLQRDAPNATPVVKAS